MPKTHMSYDVFDAWRFLQTALQSLHETLRRAGAIARIWKKPLFIGFFASRHGRPRCS
jgi:hypothetical protein